MALRLALVASLVAAALVFAVTPASAAGATVTGVAFQDVNGDGQGPQDGEAGLAGWIVWADLDANGVRDAGEPSAIADASGHYSLGPLAAGDYTLRIQPPDASACPTGATCTKPITLVDDVPAALDFAIATAADPGRQLVDPDPVRVGSVHLTLPTSCVRTSFVPAVTGPGITRVLFRVDRLHARAVKKAGSGGRWSLRLPTRRLAPGRHSLTASVWFTSHATGPAKVVRGSFRVCRAYRT